MQVRAGRASGRSEQAYGLPDPHLVADTDLDRGEMRVAGRQSVAVVDLDHLAVAAVPAGMGHGPGGGSAHRLAFLPAQIDAGVHGRTVEEGVDPDPESRGQIDLAGDRLADRHGNERARERVNLGSGKLHAIELALEHARL